MNWEDLPAEALDAMKQLGNFGPTVHAANREVKGYTYDADGVVKTYLTSDCLRNIAQGCIAVADWLDNRAEAV